MTRLISTALVTSLFAVPALAQTAVDPGDVISLDDWNAQRMNTDLGWSVDALLDSPVHGENGDPRIGEVEDVLFDPEGNIVSVIAEVGGMADVGDHHVSVPWHQVMMMDGTTGIRVPISEDTVSEYDPAEYGGIDGAWLSHVPKPGMDDADIARAWRASEFIGDYARLTGEDAPVYYGYVSDIMVQDGEINATIIQAGGSYGGGYYAYPDYTGPDMGWNPGSPYYDLPYPVEDVEGMEPVRPDNM